MVLCETAEQSRDVLGARTTGLLERSELAETDRVKIKEAISEIEKGLFEDELFPSVSCSCAGVRDRLQ